VSESSPYDLNFGLISSQSVDITYRFDIAIRQNFPLRYLIVTPNYISAIRNELVKTQLYIYIYIHHTNKREDTCRLFHIDDHVLVTAVAIICHLNRLWLPSIYYDVLANNASKSVIC
jgi:hypothetical protein